MPLSAGTRLGHCDVTALIGEGGMGQVCRTTDTTLHRDVENMNHSATRMAWRSRCLVGSGLVFGVSAVMGLAQTAPRVTHGVATGDVTATSAIVWARSDRDALMTVSYQPVVGNTEPQEVTARTASSTNLTAQAKLEGLDPGTTYPLRGLVRDSRGTFTRGRRELPHGSQCDHPRCRHSRVGRRPRRARLLSPN